MTKKDKTAKGQTAENLNVQLRHTVKETLKILEQVNETVKCVHRLCIQKNNTKDEEASWEAIASSKLKVFF